MSFDFPNTPTIGTLFDTGTGVVYAWDGAAWVVSSVTRATARRGNRVVNGNMAISQENGNTAGTTNPYYPADQFFMTMSGLSVTSGRSQSFVSPDGSLNSIIASFSVAKASLAAGDFAQFCTVIESQNVSDLRWGTAKAIPAVLRFNAACQTAGTYSVAINTPSGDQSWLATFACDGTTNLKTFVFAIPPATAGTWPNDNTGGPAIHFAYAMGSTYLGNPGWQAGNKLGVTGQTNGAAATGLNMIITDVSLFADPDNTGLPPPWEVPDYATELARCMRYWESGSFIYYAYQSAGSGFGTTQSFNVSKRTTAAMSITGQSITNATNGTLTAQGTNAFMSNAQASATGTCTHTGTYTANARM